jgi:hypothetical protein
MTSVNDRAPDHSPTGRQRCSTCGAALRAVVLSERWHVARPPLILLITPPGAPCQQVCHRRSRRAIHVRPAAWDAYRARCNADTVLGRWNAEQDKVSPRDTALVAE